MANIEAAIREIETADQKTIRLQNALNAIPGFMCTGAATYDHPRVNEVCIWLICNDICSLNKFMWGMCKRFGSVSTNSGNWELRIDNGDTNRNSAMLSLVLVGKKKWDNETRLEPHHLMLQDDCDELALCIQKWLSYEDSLEAADHL